MTHTDVTLQTARRCWGMTEPVHVVVYLTPKPWEALSGLGLEGPGVYVASRSAPLGPVPAETVEALFYVFAPRLIRAAVPGAWDVTTPQKVITTRYSAVSEVLRGAVGDLDVTELAGLARTATEALTAPGRPLYAAHASLPWPDDPLMQLWHAAVLLREHRGDAHMTALLHGGFDPVEALITDGVVSGNWTFGKNTRGWTDDEWQAGLDRMQSRGWLVPDAERPGRWLLTDLGREKKQWVETATDAASLEGWGRLGEDGCARYLELIRPVRAAIRDTGTLPGWIFGR
ncbi:hypothetical protein ACIB24_01720 [Spongisporangium articulatum]|uniref:Uncharacterized protein n=1 Tax=Spongisporangium articulatum TaxID=3362603 RepID=A0ABW8AHE5_9ACTN